MGILSDYMASQKPAETRLEDESPGQTMRGLRSGLTGIGAGASAMLGTGGEALGFNDFAQSQYKRADTLQAEAQAQAPRITSYKDVMDPGGDLGKSLRNGFDYTTGLLGGSLPSIAVGTGAALATGGGAIPALLASTAAQLPIEAGDVALKQRADPEALQQSAGERFGRQLIGGAGSAALQSVVPAMVSGRILGTGVQQAERQTLRQIAGRNLASIPEEAVLEGGSEAFKQLATNEAKPFDQDAILENVIGGGVAGGAFAGAGFVGEAARAIPRNAVQDVKDAAQGAATSGSQALSSVYDGVKSSTESILSAMKNGFDEKAPQSVKDGVDYLKGSIGDQVAEAKSWLNEITSAEDVPAAIKAEAVALGGNLMNRSSRAGLWAMKQAKDAGPLMGQAAGAARDATTGAADYLRGFNKPAEDTELDRLVAGKPQGDLTAFNASTPEAQESIVKSGFARTGEIVKKAIDSLAQRADLTDLQRADLMAAQENIGDTASALTVSAIQKAVKVKDVMTSRLSALVKGVSEAVARGPQTDTKKSEEYDGVHRSIVNTIAPVLSRNHQELLDNPSMLQLLGDGLRDFIKLAAEGNTEAVSRYSTDFTRILGADDTHEILNSLSEVATGGDPAKMASYFQLMQTMLDQDTLDQKLVSVIQDSGSGGENKTGDAQELATYLVRWHNGDESRGKTPEQVRYNDTRINRQLIAEFGPEGAARILSATEAHAKSMQGKMKADTTFDSDTSDGSMDDEGGFESPLEKRNAERESRSAYIGKDDKKITGDAARVPKTYPRPDMPGKSGFANATKQAIERINIQDPGTRAFFVSLRDYAKARDWTEKQILGAAEGANPDEIGYLKTETIDSNDGLRDYQLSKMRMDTNFDKRKVVDEKSGKATFVDTRDALRITKDGKPTSIAYDSSRVAQSMSDASRAEWTDMENSAGWSTRLASKFAEGVAALMQHHDGAIALRDDMVIGYVNGEKFTWGEGQKAMRDYRSDKSKNDKGDAEERKAREFVPELDDQALASLTAKVDTALDNRVSKYKKALKEDGVRGKELAQQMKAFMADETSGVPKLQRMQSTLSFEADKRSGDTLRSDLLGSGEETRDGFKVDNMRVGAAEGVRKAASKYLNEFMQKEAAYKAGRPIEGTDDAAKPTGRQEGDRDGNISEAAATVNAGDLVRQNTNLKGPVLDTKSVKLAVARLRKNGEGNAVAGKIADQLETVLGNIRMMSANDAVELMRVNKDMSPSTVAAIINPLASKYADRTTAPSGEVSNVDNQRPGDKGRMPVERGRPTTAPVSQAEDAQQRADLALQKTANGRGSINDANLAEVQRRVDLSRGGPRPAESAPAAIETVAPKRNAIVEAVAAKDAASAGSKQMGSIMAKYQDYLNNPPADYTTERATQIVGWAEKQMVRLSQAMDAEDPGSARHDQLSDLRSDARLLAKKGREITGADAELESKLGPQGSAPSPKLVAAKTAALLEAASSSDPKLLKELATSDDAKALQRAVQALAGREGTDAAVEAANTRLGQLVQDPQTALGMQGKKYSLESSTEESNGGQAKLITRLADARRGEFVYAAEGEVFTRAEGTTSFGPVREGTKFFFSDGRRTHAYIVAPEHFAAVKYNLSVKPLERHADVLAYLATQHAFYDRATGEFQSFAPLPSSPPGQWLESAGAVKPTGEFFGDGTSPINRVLGVTTRQTADFLADALAYTKHIVGEDKVFVDWTRITGAKTGKQGSGMFSNQSAASTNPMTAKGRKQIEDYINNVLGKSVTTEFAALLHAGEYDEALGNAIIRISTHALNPTTVAYHESLHALFSQLRKSGSDAVIQVLENMASSPAVMSQLKKLLAKHPAALKQLSDPEERAAYAYQFWASGDLKLGEKATTIFGKVAEALRKVLGIWTNDERAIHIMEYFSSGEYAQNMGKPSVVRQALLAPGRNQAVEGLQQMAAPFTRLGEELIGAGSANLRDSGIPALRELANIIKKRGVDEGQDAGFIPAARLARAKYMNDLAKTVGAMSPDAVNDALDALQRGVKAATPEGRIAARAVRTVLDDMFGYLGKAGVDVNDLGVGTDYFPRRWDPHFMSTHKSEFLAMAAKYPQWKDPEVMWTQLVNDDGSELRVVDRPGMASRQQRSLAFISHEDAAPFMSKDLYQTLNSYVTQATRRAEYARRLGDDNSGANALLARAVKEGAAPGEIDYAKRFLAGVNGTLGDDLNPTARRLMGNMVVYQNIRLLPMAIFSSVVDPMGIMVRGGTVSDAWGAFTRGIREIPKGLKGDTSADAQTQMAVDMGVIDSAVLQHSLGALYTQGVSSDFARKVNDTFFKYNLMEQFNTSMRVAATQSAMSFIVRHMDGKGPNSARWMAELGLTRSDVVLVNGKLATTTADGLSEAQAGKVRAAVNQWVDGAVLRPDAADKPVWFNDPKFMLISHLKQFVYSFQHTILQRVMHEARNGNYTPAMALTSYVPIMIAADMVKGLVQGGGDVPEWKRGWDASDYVASGVQRAGLFGVGQIGVDVATAVRRGDTGFAALAGPTVEQFGDALSVVGGKQQFGAFALKSLPANAVFAESVRTGGRQE